VSKPPIHAPPVPKDVMLRLAKLAGVPTNDREAFCEHASNGFLRLWKRDRRAVSSNPGPALIKAAKAARTLQEAFYRLKKHDREWVDNILSSEMQFELGEIHHLESTILNLAMVFSAAIGRPTSLPPHLGRSLGIKDQMLRDLVFSLLSAATESHGKFTLDKNSQSGTLLKALDILRPHLPKGLVPKALPVGTVQKLKTDFFRLARL
jgi:hypothetical protein